MASHTPPPLLSRHPTNPAGQTDKIRRAYRAISKRLDVAQKVALDAFASIPVSVRNARQRNYYDYQISAESLRLIVQAVEQVLRDDGRDVLADEVIAAYREGRAKAAANIIRLTDDYSREISEVLSSYPVQRRAALAASRVYELMDGFNGTTAEQLSFEIFRAVQDGINPREAARKIRKRFDVSKHRALRIARTEITMGLRRGRWDEGRDAADRLNLNMALLHQSALIPGRTRRTHAERHGKIVTVQEQADWYSEGANGINCLCSSSEVLLGKDGNPTSGQKLIERMIKARKNFLGQ